MEYPLNKPLTIHQCVTLVNDIRKAFDLDKTDIKYNDCGDYIALNTRKLNDKQTQSILSIFDKKCIETFSNHLNRTDFNSPVLIKQPDFNELKA